VYPNLPTLRQHRAALTEGMTLHTRSARPAARRTRSTILAATLVVVTAAVVALLGHPSSLPSSAPHSSTSSRQLALRQRDRPPLAPDGADRSETGVLGGTTVFRDDVAAVANLDPDLLRALRRAAREAALDGVEIDVTSGWRSRQHQERLFRRAVATYGSRSEAARWVAVPGTSLHEAGDAVDLGPSQATAWLSGHGARFGLCQIYGNEPWHYELRPDAAAHGCPPMYADPTQDPRMHR
jgi:D-alanyl-D-alanine carboxypeptidase